MPYLVNFLKSIIEKITQAYIFSLQKLKAPYCRCLNPSKKQKYITSETLRFLTSINSLITNLKNPEISVLVCLQTAVAF